MKQQPHLKQNDNEIGNKSRLNISEINSKNLDKIFDDPIKKNYYLYLEDNAKTLRDLLDELMARLELNNLQNSELTTEITQLKK